MSFSNEFNAAIAIMEGNTKVAREILRSQGERMDNNALIIRMYTAIDKIKTEAVSEELENVLMESMKLETSKYSNEEKDLYYKGVSDVENIIEARINEYKKEQTLGHN